MEYPSVYLSALADWLESWEPHEKVEMLADRVETVEQPVERVLDGIKNRVTAYSQLQEVRQELKQAKNDRMMAAAAYGSLAKSYKAKTGEHPPVPQVGQQALKRGLQDASPIARRLSEILGEIKRGTRYSKAGGGE